MRPTIATILLILMTFQVMYKGIVFSSYFANKSYIAAVLCENKAKPELQCEGKCYLKKQLKKAEAPEGNASGLTLKLDSSPFTTPGPFWAAATVPAAQSTKYCIFRESGYRCAYLPSCFHPPQV
ncbi:hypothetical protein [uncultured Pontibacter sp.]|uniref:hypothetical protein n=1 Tax=uncultured Pontibacter sp. TaxID=453356 RepID=UPI0026204B16|nr:hypothetical protein [uncultured Pontibacter sp.]